MPPARNYHHGDLRRSLLDASLALVDEQGIGALSLREVARKAGVSHNAPYHHFPDKGSLLAAIAEEGFQALAAEMTAARVGVTDPLARLATCGRSYVRFAVRSPAHFRVMFRHELADPAAHQSLVPASHRPFQMLVQTVIECQSAGQAPPGDPMPLVLTCWSSMHGVASLWLDGPLALDMKGFGGSPEHLADMVVQTLMSLLVAARPGKLAGGPGKAKPPAKPRSRPRPRRRRTA